VSDTPTLETLRAAIPDFAKDIRLSLGSLASETILTDQQKWGTFLASALAGGVPEVIKTFAAEAETRLSPEAITAANAAASIMAMNNVYYRSLHLMKNGEYQTMRAGLRMNILANPGVDKIDFELWSLAVSAINGCGMCLDSHEKTLRQHEASAVMVQTALRIAAVVQAASAILRAEAAKA
jgi:lipoyl-dependent peroxiredoxin subunit D